MQRLFGTDGVRGRVGQDLTAELAERLGRAAATVLGSRSAVSPPKVVIGGDTRASTPLLTAALAAGFVAEGFSTELLGVIPTPGVAFLTRELGASCGAVVSASHNPAEDNGIKFFGPDGYKLDDATEDAIEASVPPPGGGVSGRIGEMTSGSSDLKKYRDHLLNSLGGVSLKGLRLVVDGANGAASEIAPEVLMAAGADVSSINVFPDGWNINAGCGSTHPEQLQAEVQRNKADAGLAFDGDADRLQAVDSHGSLVDGDQILAAAAIDLLERGELAGRRVVATVMSNQGFRIAMRDAGITVIDCPVGDRYVIEAMKESGASLGGEQSGHIIFAEHATTGDGVLTALQLLRTMVTKGASLAEVTGVMTRIPQVLINVAVNDKSRLDSAAGVWESVREAAMELGDSGRVLVRASGTENLVRVMVESQDQAKAEQLAEQVAGEVERELGPGR